MAVWIRRCDDQHRRVAICFDPKHVSSPYVYAAVLAQRNQFDDAQQQVETAIAIDPSMPQAYDLHGLILLQDGKDAAASIEFCRALQLNPLFSPAHLHLAMALIQTGDRAGTLAQLRIAAAAPDPGIAQQAREMQMKLEDH